MGQGPVPIPPEVFGGATRTAPHRSIRTLLLLLLVATIVLFAILMIGSYLVDTKQDLQRAESAFLAMVQLAAGDLSGLLSDHEHALHALAASAPVLAMDPANCDSVLDVLDDMQSRDRNLIVADREGRIVCSGVVLSGRTSGAEFLRTVVQSGQVKVSGVFTDAVTQRRLILMAMPLRNSAGQVSGVIALPVDMTRYQQQLRSVLGAEAMLTVLDQNGDVVARSRERNARPGQAAVRPEVIALARAETQGTTIANGIDGTQRLYVFSTVPRYGWTIYVGVPTDAILGPVRGWARIDVTLWLVVLALITVLTTSTAGRIVEPIQNLAEVAQSIGHGHSAGRALVEGPLEVQQVATQFNAMVDRLEDAVERERELFDEVRALSGRVLEVQEEERKRISREIHDDLGQKLAALRMDLAGSVPQLGGSGLQERAVRMIEVVDSTIDTVRRLALELRPAMLDDLGLVPVVEREVRQFEQRTGISCNLSVRPADLSVGSEESTAVYRILQETLTNVARHSKATEVDIRLWRDDKGVLLEVRDNGVGITSRSPSGRKGLGLVGIRERAMMLGGSANIEGAAGEGTVVTVRLPMSAGAAA